MAITYFGSGICSYNRRTRLAILNVTVPATIMRSACRGVARNAPAPNRSRSKRLAPTAIISMAQHASPKVIGQIEFLRPQLMKKSRLVTMTPSSKRFSIQDIAPDHSRRSIERKDRHVGLRGVIQLRTGDVLGVGVAEDDVPFAVGIEQRADAVAFGISRRAIVADGQEIRPPA